MNESNKRKSSKAIDECKVIVNETRMIVDEYEFNNEKVANKKEIVNLVTFIESELVDIRMSGKVKYPISSIIMLIFVNICIGFYNCSEFEYSCGVNKSFFKKLGLLEGKDYPHRDTFIRVLKSIDSRNLCDIFRAIFTDFISVISADEEIYCGDGKYLCGTDRKEDTIHPQKTLGSFFIYSTSSGTVLASAPVESKESEMVVAQIVLEQMNIKGKIIYLDALHTQGKTSSIIAAKGAFYLLTLKENQKTLYDEVDKYLKHEKIYSNKSKQRYSTYENKIGRNEIFLFPINNFYGTEKFEAATYIVLYRKTNKKTGEITDLFHITSIKQSYKIFETIKRRWNLETHHQLKDNILEEDSLRYTDKTIANNIAIIDNFVINYIKLVKEVTKAPSVKAAAKFVRINFCGAFETVIKAYGKHRLIKDTLKEKTKKEIK